MNKITKAIYHLHEIDYQSKQDTFINNLHPLIKLLLTILYLILLTSLDKYNLNQTLAMGIYLGIISIFFDLEILACLKNFKLLFVLLVIIALANPILDQRPLFKIANIIITGGMVSFVTLILKGSFALIAVYFLMITTSIEKICQALKCLHLPNLFITVLLLIYRYLMVFLKEVERIWLAYQMRSPGQKGVNIKVWGSMIGSLLIRSIDKAQLVYQSMEIRGFDPDGYFLSKQTINFSSILFFIFGVIILLIIRFIPLLELMGKLFI